MVKNLPSMWEPRDPLKKHLATHSSILIWRIPWTEEHGGSYSQSTESQRVGHDRATNTHKIITLDCAIESHCSQHN